LRDFSSQPHCDDLTQTDTESEVHHMSKDSLPKGGVAIVVGAGGELGRATALTLANRGMRVVAVDRNEAGLEGLPASLAREVVDATDPKAAAPMVERIVRDVGSPSVLVNTIGAFLTGDALTTTPDQLRLMIDVNLGSALWLSQAVAPYMERSGSGAIVHIAARPGIEPSGGMAAYSASKAALVHLARILDVELRPLGIRVNCIAPQLLDTATVRAAFPKEVLAHAVAPEAIAEVVAFLVSEAAAPISGAIIPAYGT
jgi:NAD(P)-dependent dehydrogenase (short-subunit alcohol dehydrogenase family)